MKSIFTTTSAETLKKLERIAMNSDINLERRGGIDSRWNDDEDFPTVSIWAIQAMLERAYRLGKEDGEKLGYVECFDDYKLHKMTPEQIAELKTN